ncbi:unnamed protein product [Calypogeia fissa]
MELFRGGGVVLSWMRLSLLLLVLHFMIFSTTTSAQGIVIRIDSGGFLNFTDQYNQTWIQDSYFTGGSASLVSQPGNFSQIAERTIRYFPTTGGKKHCYLVPVPNGRYFVRMFFVYDNYDNKALAPNFDVSVENTVVFSWRYPWTGSIADVGAYSDLTTYVQDGELSACFYSLSTDAPLIGALEVVEVDPLSYDSPTTGQNVILVNYGRLTGGNTSFGAGLTNDTDVGGRAWEVDTNYSPTSKQVLTTIESIRNSNVAPNYFPTRLYQSARVLQMQPNPVIEYYFSVDSSSDYMVWMHFAEIDPTISAPKQRVFEIEVNDLVAYQNVDIFAAVGNYAAYDLNYTVKNLSDTLLHLKFTATAGLPLICGLEVLAILPIEIATDPAEGLAMQNLKTSLQIPDRMGWNGDPCAPSTWDAWDGVSCTLVNDGKSLVISHIDLSNQGLIGVISDSITQLGYLLNLNLSNNEIGGSIPAGLGANNNLESVDLSTNGLTGTIPDSLGSPQLRKVLLNENLLSGQVPESLYSIGVEGGFINLSLNKGLCGIPSLPACPNFWSKGGMSTGAKVGIAFGVLAAVALFAGLIWFYIKKRNDQDDYNFGLPHQLAMRHKRYMQYRATLQFNNEDGHMMRVSPSKYGFSTTMNTL